VTNPRHAIEERTRRNPTEALRQRLLAAGFPTTFYGDEFVQSLLKWVARVNLADLWSTMREIAAESFERYSVPIVLLD